MNPAPNNSPALPPINLPDAANFLQWLPKINEYFPLDRLPWLFFIIAMIAFGVISIILVHHWKAYGQGVIMFLLATITYSIGAGTLIWAAFLLLNLYSVR